MRELPNYESTGVGKYLKILVLDSPSEVGQSSRYVIQHEGSTYIDFHQGDETVGINGVTDLSLLSILEDRFQGLLESCNYRDNALSDVLKHIQCAIGVLNEKQRS